MLISIRSKTRAAFSSASPAREPAGAVRFLRTPGRHRPATRHRQCELTYSRASAVFSNRVELLSRT